MFFYINSAFYCQFGDPTVICPNVNIVPICDIYSDCSSFDIVSFCYVRRYKYNKDLQTISFLKCHLVFSLTLRLLWPDI